MNQLAQTTNLGTSISVAKKHKSVEVAGNACWKTSPVPMLPDASISVAKKHKSVEVAA
jgi:hypothetical protein